MSDNKKKILVIEDDPQIAKVYRIKLVSEGFEPILVEDGEEGLKKIIEEKPALIMLDLMLPKKDGFWVLTEMKKNSTIAKIPVLVLSNLGQEQDKKRALDLGAKDYMVKADNQVKAVINKVKLYIK